MNNELINEKASIFDRFFSIIVLMILAFYICSIIIMFLIGVEIEDLLIVCVGLLCFVLLLKTSLHLSESFGTETDLHSMLILFFISFILLITWDRFVNAQPVSDYKVLWEGAQQIVDGSFQNRVVKKTDYYYFYRYQIGYACYLSLLYRLFNGSLAAVKVIEAVVMSLTNVVLFKTLRLFSGRIYSFFGTALFIFYPFIFMGGCILNNQHEAMLLEALTVYLYLKYTDERSSVWYDWVIIGVLLYIANFLRPTAFVILIAILLLSIFRTVFNKDLFILKGGLIIVITYLIVSSLTNQIFIISELAPYGIKGGNLWFKIILGLTGEGITHNPTTDAEHTNLYYDLQYFGFDYNAYNRAAKDYVIEMIRTGKISVRYICSKMVYFTGGFDNQVDFLGSRFTASHSILVSTLGYIGLFIYCFSLVLSSIRCWLNSIIKNNEIFLPVLIFGGYFLVYILFETQTRYRYEQYYMLFLLFTPVTPIIMSFIKKRSLYHKLNHHDE